MGGLLFVAPPASDLGVGVASAETVERRVEAMGTWLRVVVAAQDRSRALAASEAAIAAVTEVDRRLSTWRDDSELTALNRSAPGARWPLSFGLAADLALARRLSRQTGGAFDPVIGALVAAWDLRGEGRVPRDGELAAALRASGMSRLEVGRAWAQRQAPGVAVEEGAFAKGVALDAAATAARAAGAGCVELDFGGQVVLSGACEAREVAVAHPCERTATLLGIPLAAGSLATSGNSERRRLAGGERIGHILDPRTGRPARDFGSVTVWAADATTADALSTALFVMGPEEGLEWLHGQPGVEALYLVVELSGVTSRPSEGMRSAIGPPPRPLGGAERSAANDTSTELRPPPAVDNGGRSP